MSDFDSECPRCHGNGMAQPTPPPASAPRSQPRQPTPPPAQPPASAAQQTPQMTIGGVIGLLILIFAVMPFMCARSVPGELGGNIITLSEYSQVQNGMSYSQVAAIIGDPGQETGRTDAPELNLTITMYSWQNPDGSNMQTQFSNDKLTTKAQAGLH
jgi:hypothetical protein